MIITRTDNTITLDSAVAAGYTYVHITQKITTLETTIFDDAISESSTDVAILTDGYYIFTEIKLPITGGSGYYISGDTVYDASNNEVSIDTLLTLYTGDSNILREDYDYIFYNYLYTYYINLIKARFLKNMCGCNCSSIDRVTLDTLTMGFAVLDQLIEYEQFTEAVRIIEQLSVCSNIINTNCSCNG